MKKKIFITIILLVMLLPKCTQIFAFESPSPQISDEIKDNDSTADESFSKNTLNYLTEGDTTYKKGTSNTSQISTYVPGSVIAGILTFLIIPIPLSINAILSMTVMSDMPTIYPRWFTIESLLSGKFDLFDINFFNIEESNTSVNVIIKKNVATWFYALRNFAIVALLAVLIYIGILMAISEVASEKSKYKKMLTSWFASFIIIFVLQYMLAIAINVSNAFVKIIQDVSHEETWVLDEFSQEDEMEVQLLTGDGKNEGLFAQIIANNGWNKVAYAIVYCVLIYYQFKFFFIYLKRFFTVGFLTAVSPLITITYSIDKAGDNQAQAYKNWLKEILIAIFIQPIHLMFFIIFMESTSAIIPRVPMLAILLIGVISKAETIIRKLFKFNGNSVGALKGKRWQVMIKKKRLNKKKIIIYTCIILSFAVLFMALYINRIKKETASLLPYQMTNIEDIFKYYNCKLIKKENSNDENLEFDLYVKFDRTYYTDDKSNKAYFTSLISYLSEVLEYDNFALIDKQKDINITVIGNKKERNISKIFYNNDMTLFEKKENEQAINEYKKINTTQITTESAELKKIIENNWKTTLVNFGKKESTFNDYDIYFDEGIEVKTTANVIYNLIFTEKYQKNIVNGLKVNDSYAKIKSQLGEPTFYDKGLNILGYKGKDFYIFFSKNEVSIYRVEKNYENEKIINLINNFITQKDKTTFINSLTDLWNDYDMYSTSENYINIKYTVKGVEFSFTKTGGKITFYQNYEGQIAEGVTLSNLNKQNIPQYGKLELTTNLIFKEEKYRKDMNESYYDEEFINMPPVPEYEGENRKIRSYNNEKYYLLKNIKEEGYSNIKFVCIDRTKPNCELKSNIIVSYYGWLDNENFIYSIKNKGIYKYNLITGKTTVLIEENEEFELKEIMNNKIKYDNGKTITVK